MPNGYAFVSLGNVTNRERQRKKKKEKEKSIHLFFFLSFLNQSPCLLDPPKKSLTDVMFAGLFNLPLHRRCRC